MSSYKILFLGDIVGNPGREAVRAVLPRLVNENHPLFVLANGENAAGGVGITPPLAEELFEMGIHGLTLGNHAFHKREILDYLDKDRPIARPANMPKRVPGRGTFFLEREGIRLGVMNLCGRVFLETYNDPFEAVDLLIQQAGTTHLFLDFHAEATSEKLAMSYYVDGRVSVIVGTHTHVQTADERVLPSGTAAITDVGMCGPTEGVIGMDKEAVLRRFTTSLPTKFEVATGASILCAILVEIDRKTGRALAIQRLQIPC